MKKVFTKLLLITALIIAQMYYQQYQIYSELKFIEILIDYALFILVLSAATNIGVYAYRKKRGLAERTSDNIIAGVSNIYVLIAGTISIFTFITLLGYNVKEVFGSLSIIAAAIAIISKDYISNIIGGMLIAFSNDVTIGDYIKVGNNKGKVIDMSITMFNLLTDDDDVVIVPNNMVYALELINYTKRAIKKTSIEFEINWGDVKGVKELEDELISTLETYHHLIQPDSYNLKTVSIKADYVEFKFQYILDTPNKELEKEIRKKVVRKVIRIIKELKPIN